MKNHSAKLTIIIVIMCQILILSCRFSKPLTSKLVETETITADTITVIKSYNYFRISRYGVCGSFRNTKKYVEDELIYEENSKRSTNRGICDGRQVSKRRTIEYNNGKYSKVEKYVFKTIGRGGKRKLSKTLIYDNQGKLIQKINNIKR